MNLYQKMKQVNKHFTKVQQLSRTEVKNCRVTQMYNLPDLTSHTG